MNKQIVTLNIGDFAPKVTAITLPSIGRWADKIGAEFKMITKPVFNMDPASGHGGEKFQLYELSKGYDWTIYIDADALVHPDTPDWTELVDKSVPVFHGLDMSLSRFRATDYVRRFSQFQWGVHLAYVLKRLVLRSVAPHAGDDVGRVHGEHLPGPG